MIKSLLKYTFFKNLKKLHNKIYVLGMHWTEYRESWLTNLSGRENGDRILDAGCGNAWIKNEFARYDTPVEYYGVDLAVGDENLTYKVSALADLHYLPFKNDSFDKAISNSVLEHVENPARVFSEMVRVVRPGGQIYLSVPFSFALHQRPYDYHRFSKYILELYAVRNNLKIVSLWPMGGFFTVLRYIFTNHTMSSFNDHKLWLFVFGIVNYIIKFLDRTIIAPVIFLLDKLDRNKYLTLGYFVVYEKLGESKLQLPSDLFRCPICEDDKASLIFNETDCLCSSCEHRFKMKDSVPDLSLSDSFKPRSNMIDEV